MSQRNVRKYVEEGQTPTGQTFNQQYRITRRMIYVSNLQPQSLISQQSLSGQPLYMLD